MLIEANSKIEIGAGCLDAIKFWIHSRKTRFRCSNDATMFCEPGMPYSHRCMGLISPRLCFCACDTQTLGQWLSSLKTDRSCFEYNIEVLNLPVWFLCWSQATGTGLKQIKLFVLCSPQQSSTSESFPQSFVRCTSNENLEEMSKKHIYVATHSTHSTHTHNPLNHPVLRSDAD